MLRIRVLRREYVGYGNNKERWWDKSKGQENRWSGKSTTELKRKKNRAWLHENDAGEDDKRWR